MLRAPCRRRARGCRMLLWVVVLGTACAMAAGTEPAVEPSPIPTMTEADLEAGQAQFRVHCARCHGMLGAGGEGPSLKRPSLRHAPDDQALFDVISEGIPGTGMPGVWAPNDTELWQIAGYVRSLGRLPAEPVPGDPERGERIYQTEGCAACHISNGTGRGVGPELSDVGLRRNAAYLRRALADPDADSPMRSSQLTGRIDAFLTVRLVGPGGEQEGLRVSEDEFSIQVRDLSGAIRSFDKHTLQRFEKVFGHSLMPGYETRLSDSQIDDLVSYLMSLKGDS